VWLVLIPGSFQEAGEARVSLSSGQRAGSDERSGEIGDAVLPGKQIEPAGRDGGCAVQGSGELPGDSPDGVGTAGEVDREYEGDLTP
jgi:hypothetical protein